MLSQKFRECHARYAEAFSSPEKNSINHQLAALAHDWMIFQAVNETRNPAIVGEQQQEEKKHALQGFIDRAFYPYFFAAVRRQLDESYSIVHPTRGIYSLAAVVADLLKNRDVLVRSNLRHAGQSLPESPEGAAGSHTLSFRDRYLDSLLTEKHLSGDRERDQLPVGHLTKLATELKRLDKFKAYTDKFIAHAASRSSRESESAEKLRVRFGDLSDAFTTLCRVRQVLSTLLFATRVGVIPETFDDPIVDLDRAIVDSEHLPRICERIEAWKVAAEASSNRDGDPNNDPWWPWSSPPLSQ